MTDISRQPGFARFSHIHTLQTSFQFSSHVSRHTTLAHTRDQPHTPLDAPLQTSRHSPRLSLLPSFRPHTPPSFHPRSPLDVYPVLLSRLSDIHILSSTFYTFSIPCYFATPSQTISIFWGTLSPRAPWPTAQGAPPPVSPPAYGILGTGGSAPRVHPGLRHRGLRPPLAPRPTAF